MVSAPGERPFVRNLRAFVTVIPVVPVWAIISWLLWMALSSEDASRRDLLMLPFALVFPVLLAWEAICQLSIRFFDWGIMRLTPLGWRRVCWPEIEGVERDNRWGWIDILNVRSPAGNVRITLDQFKDNDELLTWMHDRLVETNPRFRDEAALPPPSSP